MNPSAEARTVMNRLRAILLVLVCTPACDLLEELEQRGADDDPGTLLLEVSGSAPLGFVAWTASGDEVLMQQRASDGTGLLGVQVPTGATRRLATPMFYVDQRGSMNLRRFDPATGTTGT